ncbi:MAG: DUF397 domain-containing protein [Actinomycetota bacterium]|nr:DUF397 domain-containing protein [Actinomycetota bacterium]
MHIPDPRLAGASWRTSSYSASSGECVAVAGLADGGRAVRDSKNPTGPALIVTPSAWAAFTTGVRDDEFH